MHPVKFCRPLIGLAAIWFLLVGGALSYQGQQMARIETEPRWQFWKRYSLVGFIGSRLVWNNFERFQNNLTLLTGGVGLRYEIAGEFGVHMGTDVAFGPS